MKRRILLVDDEVAVLLTMKAVLEITGFEVDTAASAREGRSRLRTHQYQMVITDMRMENDQAGREVIQAARTAPYRPAVALLTAFPVDEADWQGFGADQLLLKPMHTRVLLDQIEKLFASHEKKLEAMADAAAPGVPEASPAALPSKQAKSKAPAKRAAKTATKAAAKAKKSSSVKPATQTTTKATKAAPKAGAKVAKSSAGRTAR
jgi:DNA-binding response OmpR family regulator